MGFATKAKTSRNFICTIERWDRRPRYEACERIAQALGVSVSEVWPDLKLEIGS